VWIQQAIFDHSDSRSLKFYAYPNPAPALGRSTLYWDLSHMPSVRTIAVHVGTESGDLLANASTSSTRSLSIAIPTPGSAFVLVDTTGGAHKVLGTVTVAVQ
jgi:hypothetical protein